MAEQAESIEELLQQCTVRLEIGDGHGTGFFVAPRLVLTCAHVVEHYKAGEPTGEPTEEPIKAVWSAGAAEDPGVEIEEFRPNPYPDLALLKVDIDDHPCVYLDDEVGLDDRLYSFGYTDDYPTGDPATFRFEGKTGEPVLGKLKAGQARPGLSGSPILNRRKGGVCGLVKRSRDVETDLGGRAILTKTVLSTFHVLKELQADFHGHHESWRLCLSAEQQELLGFIDPLREELGRYLEDLIEELGQRPPQFPAHVDFNLDRIHARVRIRPESGGRSWNDVSQDWEEVRAGLERAVILGAPGCGKTWLLRHEGRRIAREQLAGLRGGDTSKPTVIPAYIRLDALATEIGRGMSVEEGVAEILARSFALADPTRIWLTERLPTERGLLLLDGLDEVPQEDRRSLRSALSDFTRGEARILLSSRPVGYLPPFPAGQATEVELGEFEPGQVSAFIREWFAQAPQQGANLIAELERRSSVERLSHVPLLLSFLCLLYAEEEVLPKSRSELYEAILVLLLEGGWRGREQEPLRLRRKLALYEELAWRFAAESWQVRLPQAKVVDAILASPEAELLETRGTDLFLELSENDGILVRAGADPVSARVPYAFLHSTIQEYLVAKRLARGGSEAVAEARKHLWFDLSWAEVIVLLAGLLDDPCPLLEAIRAEPNDIFHEMRLLAGRCVAESTDTSSCSGLAEAVIADVGTLLWSTADRDRNRGTEVLGQLGERALFVLEPALTDEHTDARRAAAKALDSVGERGLPLFERALTDEEVDVRREAVGGLAAVGKAGVPLLEQGLKDEDAHVRRAAVEGLGALGRPVQSLLEALADEDADVRTEAVEALGALGERGLPLLEQGLADQNYGVRYLVTKALRALGEAALPLLERALQDENGHVHQAAVEGLGAVGERGLPLLEQALADQRAYVRYAAVTGLCAVGEAALPLLERALQDEHADVRQAAVRGLGALGVRGLPLLEQALSDEEVQVRRLAVARFGALGAQGLPLLEQALQDEDAYVRQTAVGGLGALYEATLPLLEQALSDEEVQVRRAAVAQLGALGERGLPLLEQALADESENIRWNVVEALGALGEAAVPLLEQARNDEDAFVRGAAIDALGAVGEAGLPLLEQSLADENAGLRVGAVEGLGALGEAALPLLERALQDEEWMVRCAAVEALGAVGEPALPQLEQALEDASVRLLAVLTLGALGERGLERLLEAWTRAEELEVRLDLYQGLAQVVPAAYAKIPTDVRMEWRARFMQPTAWTLTGNGG
jgi:HEAT repeat protein